MSEGLMMISGDPFNSPASRVTRIELWLEPNGQFMTLGRMFEAGYVPSRIFRARISGPDTVILLIVWGPQEQILTVVDGFHRVDSTSPITGILLTAPGNRVYALNDVRFRWHFEDEVGWHGFTSVDTYWDAVSISHVST
jgi:hypothetical protein